MKTRDEVEDLKRQWIRDPIWDLESSEGFSDYDDELLLYSLKWKLRWENERLSRIIKHEEQFNPVHAAFEAEKCRENVASITDRIFEVSGLTTMEYIK